MARQFDNAFNQFMQAGSAVVTAPPLTMACWFNSDDDIGAQALVCLGSSTNTDMFTLCASGDIANDPVRLRVYQAGVSDTVATTTGYSTNTWHHACAVAVASDDRAVYLDGGGKDTTGVDKTVSVDRTGIGSYVYSNTNGWYMSGAIAEAAVWNAALTDAEVAVLATGIRPIMVRPQSIVAYWPLVRDQDYDIVGGYDMTPINVPTISAHVPIIYGAAFGNTAP